MDTKTILLVDDEQDIIDVYKMSLEQSGFTVLTAKNGAEGIEQIKQKHPDLVLMDLKMPVMDGIEAFMKIQETPEIKATKVVFLTAFSDPRTPEIDIRKSKEIGAVDFIKKGISLDEFVERVKGYLA